MATNAQVALQAAVQWSSSLGNKNEDNIYAYYGDFKDLLDTADREDEKLDPKAGL